MDSRRQEKDSPQPNNPDDVMLKAITTLKAATTVMEAVVAVSQSEGATTLGKAAASIREAFTPVVSADPAPSSQNIVQEPNAV